MARDGHVTASIGVFRVSSCLAKPEVCHVAARKMTYSLRGKFSLNYCRVMRYERVNRSRNANEMRFHDKSVSDCTWEGSERMQNRDESRGVLRAFRGARLIALL